MRIGESPYGYEPRPTETSALGGGGEPLGPSPRRRAAALGLAVRVTLGPRAPDLQLEPYFEPELDNKPWPWQLRFFLVMAVVLVVEVVVIAVVNVV